MHVFAFQVNPDYRDENIDTKSEVRQTEVEVGHFIDFSSFSYIHSIFPYSIFAPAMRGIICTANLAACSFSGTTDFYLEVCFMKSA